MQVRSSHASLPDIELLTTFLIDLLHGFPFPWYAILLGVGMYMKS
jgi:hypothetical protein